MNAFSYVTPQTPEAAVKLGGAKSRYLAGGIDLLGELKEGLAQPAMLVNVKALPSTQQIARGPNGWTIGANATLTAVAEHAGLRKQFPAITQAAADVGSPQIRNVATVGGNLAQHSRCWYYRHRDVECRKKGGTTCFARGGENKYHSLFTRCMCISPLVSNLAIAFAALDAQAVVQRGTKVERLSMAQLYANAMRIPTAHNSLRPGDLILRVEIPETSNGRSIYLQMAEKSDFDWALVSCAASASFSSGVLSRVRIVLGCVAPIPWQVEAANEMLDGKVLTEELAANAAEAMLRDASAYSGNGYKVPIARVLVVRALKGLVDPARSEERLNSNAS